MPHDTKGRLIEVGDVVRAKIYDRGQLVDRAVVVTEVNAAAASCNVKAIYTATLEGHFNASDVELLTKKDGSVLFGVDQAASAG
jgi:hypothetical protein